MLTLWKPIVRAAAKVITPVVPSWGVYIAGALEVGGATSLTGGISSTGDISVANAAGSALKDEAASSTNPTVVPNKADVDTGIGWSTDAIELIVNGTEEAKLDAAALTLPTNNLIVTAGTIVAGAAITTAGHPVMLNEVASATNPVFALADDYDTGLGSAGADKASIVAGGKEMLQAVETGAAAGDQVIVSPGVLSGAAATPALAFGDGDTGLWEGTDDILDTATAGTARMRINATGQVGIGVVGVTAQQAPQNDFHIAKDDDAVLKLSAAHNTATKAPYLQLEHYRGTHAAPSGNSAGDALGYILFAGYTNARSTAARIAVTAATGWGASGGDSPGIIDLQTTPDGSGTPSSRLTIDQTGLVTIVGQLISVGGLTKQMVSQAVVDDGEIVIATGKSGFGSVMIGDNQEFSQFRFTAAGVVTLFNNSVNVSSTDVDANLCIYDAGSGIAIKNRLGAPLTVRLEISYS